MRETGEKKDRNVKYESREKSVVVVASEDNTDGLLFTLGFL